MAREENNAYSPITREGLEALGPDVHNDWRTEFGDMVILWKTHDGVPQFERPERSALNPQPKSMGDVAFLLYRLTRKESP